jgi:hypothetical protein
MVAISHGETDVCGGADPAAVGRCVRCIPENSPPSLRRKGDSDFLGSAPNRPYPALISTRSRPHPNLIPALSKRDPGLIPALADGGPGPA